MISGPQAERRDEDRDNTSLRNVALRTSSSILSMQRRAEQELLEAKSQLEQRKAELSMSVSLLSATLESAPDGIVAYSNAGEVIAHNSRFRAIWGLSVETLDTISLPALLTLEASFTRSPDAFLRRITSTLGAPEAETYDVIEFRDGRSFERKAVPQRIDGTCVGIVVHWRDVTEQRRSADAQIALAEQLRQAQKMESLGALSGGIAHDFNNILGAILGNAELALEVGGNSSTVIESLSAIREASERAARLVQQILTFSRQTPAERTPLMIPETVREAARLLRATIPAGI